MKEVILYIHGKGGNAEEADRYKDVCPGYDVYGLDYRGWTPWDTESTIRSAYDALAEQYDSVLLLANSIGAFFAMHALQHRSIEKALFISPIVDMEKLITDMMRWANVSEQLLFQEKEIRTEFGETLSWEYLEYVQNHPISWTVPTEILYAGNDHLTSRETVEAFCKAHASPLTVMADGEHWFHTASQLAFLDAWLKRALSR